MSQVHLHFVLIFSNFLCHPLYIYTKICRRNTSFLFVIITLERVIFSVLPLVFPASCLSVASKVWKVLKIPCWVEAPRSSSESHENLMMS